MNMYYVYILLSAKDKKFYIGFTNNVERRIVEHNSGKVSSTQARRPFKLLYFEGHISQEDALRRERYYKTSKGRTTLRQVLKSCLSRLSLK